MKTQKEVKEFVSDQASSRELLLWHISVLNNNDINSWHRLDGYSSEEKRDILWDELELRKNLKTEFSPDYIEGYEKGKFFAAEMAKIDSHWISVEDSMPDKGLPIIVTDGNKVYDNTSCQEGEFWVHWYGYDNDSFKLDNITHWQPLPKPPKTEQP